MMDFEGAMDRGMREPVYTDFRSTLAPSGLSSAESEPESRDVVVEVMDFLTKHKPEAEKKGWLIRNTLSKAECTALISVSEKRGYQDANEYCFMYYNRHNDRLMCDDEQLADFLWQRVSPHIPSQLHFDTGSTWQAYGLNKRFRICKYTVGGFFDVHTDGTFAHSQDDRSFLTCMFYLNDGQGVDFSGGTTDFVSDRSGQRVIQYQLQPETGLCVVFCQADRDCLHCGTALESGVKYIMRTDVMFRRL